MSTGIQGTHCSRTGYDIDRLLHPEPSTESEDDEGDFGGKSVFDMFHDVIGTASFEPTDLGRHSEDYLRDGFGVPSESRLTQS